MKEEFEAPLLFGEQKVISEWIDFNGHMNVAYYVMAFDRCVDDMYNRLGIGPAQIGETNCSVFTLETYVNYVREVFENDPLRITGRLLDYDEKRIHVYFEMHHGATEHIVAAMEQIGIHVDLGTRRPVAFTADRIEALARMQTAHGGLPAAKYAGRIFGIRRK